VTRPEPTIYGNCDSWDFIVGKLPRSNSPATAHFRSLQHCNSIIIHMLSTLSEVSFWTTCGLAVDHWWTVSEHPASWIQTCLRCHQSSVKVPNF